MPIYIVRWPDLSASLVRAGSEEELPVILDQLANPEGCEWSPYDGPLFINFRLPAEWSIRDERPGQPVAPDQIIIGDVGPMAHGHVAETMELSLAEGDYGLDTGTAVLRLAFPKIHAAIERLWESDKGVECEGVLPETDLREALHAELARFLQVSWRCAQLERKTAKVSTIAQGLDMPASLVRKCVEDAQEHHQAEGPPVHSSDARLDEMIAEATVDCHDESEALSGIYTMLEESLAIPFATVMLGMKVAVERIELNDACEIVVVCRRGHEYQRISALDLPLPEPRPAGSEWIDAYRRWARWR